jgi:hypothetical protein
LSRNAFTEKTRKSAAELLAFGEPERRFFAEIERSIEAPCHGNFTASWQGNAAVQREITLMFS